MTASAEGIDISSYQSGYSVADLAPYQFAFFRATVGTIIKDANFAGNWAAGKAAGIHRGAYHELVPTSTATAAAQVAYFTAVLKRAGVEAGDMLAVVSSDYAGVTGAEVLSVLSALKAEFPRSPVLVYSDLNGLATVADCSAYPLWLADYTNNGNIDVKPWANWTFWQWTDSPIDRDAYNGTADELQSWLDTFVAPPAPGGLIADASYRGVTLKWDAVAGAASYEWQLIKGTDFVASALVASGVVTATTASAAVAPSTAYSVRVKAEPDGAWSEKSFTTPAAPPATIDPEPEEPGVTAKPTVATETVTTTPIVTGTVTPAEAATDIQQLTEFVTAHS